MESEQLKQLLEKTKAELAILYEIGNAMRTTLELDEILYIILTGVTSHEGLGFNRAMLFLINEQKNSLEGKLGIGPATAEEAGRIWRRIEEENMDLEDLIEAYRKLDKQQIDAPLNELVRSIRIPLTEKAGILAMTTLEGMSFEVTTETARAKIEDKILDSLKTEYFVTVPLKARNKVLGVILADNLFTKEPITKDDIRMLNLFANHAGLAIENSKLFEETKQQAARDSLTKLWNHGYFQFLLSEQINISSLLGKPFTLAMVDIDNFKKYNDTLGHRKGDEILREIARLLKENVRKADFVCRYGGEEFTIILPDSEDHEAMYIAEKIRTIIENYPFTDEKIMPSRKLTVSIGMATYPNDTKDKENLIIKADKALYEAKRLGKNRTVLFSSMGGLSGLTF